MKLFGHSKLSSYLGVDIGSGGVKVVELAMEKNRMRLLTYGYAEQPADAPLVPLDHPKETSPLCKLKRGDYELIERVESYINGWELTNGYSELTDPKKQYEEFKSQEERGRGGDEEAQKMDEDYVKALEFGLPPTGGLGIGIDRMVMLLTNQPTIRDVILFPTMKPEEEF